MVMLSGPSASIAAFHNANTASPSRVLAQRLVQHVGRHRIGQAVGADEIAGVFGQRRGDQVRVKGGRHIDPAERLGDEAGGRSSLDSRSSVLSWRRLPGPAAYTLLSPTLNAST